VVIVRDLAALEAVLFVTESPVPVGELAEVLEIAVVQVEGLLAELDTQLAGREAGLVLREVGGGWRLYTQPDAYPYLERFSASATARKLSPAALEALAVVAYRQPVARSQVSEIRGVDSDSAIRTLERVGLVEEKGRLSIPGNPAIYGTTAVFLERLGIGEIGDLPPLADHIPPADVVESLEEPFRPGAV
jgi:segregation and condensation protein B